MVITFQSRTPNNNNTLQTNSILGNRNILSITHPYSSVKDKPIHNSNNATIAILDEGIDQRGIVVVRSSTLILSTNLT
jgi:hypothetical protein